MKRKDIDAIAVTSPDYCHEDHAVDALTAGKHVFCEKPLAITVRGCDRILSAWQKSKKKLMVGFNMHYMSIFQTMKDIVDRGTIGKIKAVWVRHFVGTGGDWYYHDWHGVSKNTTSLLLQKASHDIDMIHWITGKYTKKVSAFGSLDYYGGDKPNNLTCPNCKDKDVCVEVSPGGVGVNNESIGSQCVFRKEIDVEDTFIGTEGRINHHYQRRLQEE
ncbi:MAG: hypothetical protein AUJ85_01660 [Elusimicrobia bacterium CG1_02_37_114]|nr:MAG: hypothetical protein AUJ85_01660 [Elusimicrobia bacterium CG1_02_37_114]